MVEHGLLPDRRPYNLLLRDSSRQNGVSLMCGPASVLGYHLVSDRILAIRLQGNHVHISIIQAYTTTYAAEEETCSDVMQSTIISDVMKLLIAKMAYYASSLHAYLLISLLLSYILAINNIGLLLRIPRLHLE